VKAEPFDDDEYVPPVTSAEIEDEENEVQIKDWKPDVTLAYQGELPQLIMICRS
jgi:cytochrome c-type biogenesis protein CcmE